MGNKLLTESGLKAVLSKHKIKDNGLQRVLAAYEKADDSAHDECLAGIAQVGKLAAALKKNKEVAANKTVVEYLEEVIGAAESEEKQLGKAQAEAAKTSAATEKKAQKEKEKAKDEEDDEEEEDEEEEEEEGGDYGERLLTAFKKLKTLNGKALAFIVCDARPFPAIMVAKRISSKQKEELSEIAGGSRKFLKKGSCYFADDHYVLELEQAVPGLARKVQRSVKNHTGKKLKFSHGGETAGDEEEKPEEGEAENPLADENIARAPGNEPEPENKPEPDAAQGVNFPPKQPGEEPPPAGDNPDLNAPGQPAPEAEPPLNPNAPFSIGGAVGRGCKNTAADVQAVQNALNRRANAGLKVDGQCGPKTIAAIMAFQKTMGQAAPDGRVDAGRGTARALAGTAKIGPPPAEPKPVAPPVLGKAELSKAPAVWHGTRDILKTNIEELKKGVRAHYGTEHPDFVKEIDSNLVKLDGILGKLDTKLADSLAKAHAAGGGAARQGELKNAKAILTEYIKYVRSEPLIAHIDQNPFGVSTQLKKVIVDALNHMAQSIA